MSVPRRRARTVWTDEMDAKLLSSVVRHGTNHWAKVSLDVGVDRRAVRDRYQTLTLNRSRGVPFTKEEDAELLRLFRTVGPKWKEVAQRLGGRTSKQCRGRYVYLSKNGEDETLEMLADLSLEVDPLDLERYDWHTGTWR
jgi:hypothetical protein